jgi:centriolar protein POC1
MLPTDPTLERTLRGHRGTITALQWNSNGRQLASGGADHTVMVWNFKPQLRAFRFVGHTVRCGSLRPLRLLEMTQN